MLGPYVGVAILGLLHGLEPGHGWPVALLYSTRTKSPLFHGFLSSSTLSFFHFISSIAVVVAYVLLRSVVSIPEAPLRYVAAVVLTILAYRFFKEKVEDETETQHGHTHDNNREMEHEHWHEHPDEGGHSHRHRHAKRVVLTLWGLATFAFALGFAHEEEFAFLALIAGGINPWVLIISYATSVTVALMGITLASIKAYEAIRPKVQRYEKYIPRISGAILLIMAIALVFGLA
jgi:ABC-type nickel/cobalt efflux system permease component RcnA